MAKTIKELTPEQKDEILSYIDLEDFENFSDQFNKKYFTKQTAITDEEIVSAVTGKRIKSIESRFLELAKEIDPSMTKSKLGETHLEEAIENFIPVVKSKWSELETKAKSGNDKKVNDLLEEIKQKDQSILSYKELAEKEANEKEEILTKSTSEMKNFKLSHAYNELKNKLSWIDNATDVDRLGFDTLIKTKYKIDLNDKDEIQILTSEGKPIPSKVKGGQMADPFEILDMELEVNKKKKLNNAKDSKVILPLNREKATGRELPKQYLNRVQK